MTSDEHELAGLRLKLDQTDQRLLELLNQRAGLSLEVGRIKAGNKSAIYRPEREKALLEALTTRNQGPLPASHLVAIYREILSSSRALQAPHSLAYLGPEGTFSHLAGLALLGSSFDYCPQTDLEALFRSVAEGRASMGVVPLENSLQGGVGQSLDLFYLYDVAILSEMFFRITHSLLSRAGRLDDVRAVYSHPQPLAQCEKWLRKHLPRVELIPCESTAEAAKLVAEQPASSGNAAIGHASLAGRHGLNVLASGTQDAPDNWTRFVLIGPAGSQAPSGEKSSLLFTLADQPGALATVLADFASLGLNLNKLESRPLQGRRWQYVFYVDLDSSALQRPFKDLLDELAKHCRNLKHLGAYPQGRYLE